MPDQVVALGHRPVKGGQDLQGRGHVPDALVVEDA
jgi:hypothetical protein